MLPQQHSVADAIEGIHAESMLAHRDHAASALTPAPGAASASALPKPSLPPLATLAGHLPHSHTGLMRHGRLESTLAGSSPQQPGAPMPPHPPSLSHQSTGNNYPPSQQPRDGYLSTPNHDALTHSNSAAENGKSLFASGNIHSATVGKLPSRKSTPPVLPHPPAYHLAQHASAGHTTGSTDAASSASTLHVEPAVASAALASYNAAYKDSWALAGQDLMRTGPGVANSAAASMSQSPAPRGAYDADAAIRQHAASASSLSQYPVIRQQMAPGSSLPPPPSTAVFGALKPQSNHHQTYAISGSHLSNDQAASYMLPNGRPQPSFHPPAQRSVHQSMAYGPAATPYSQYQPYPGIHAYQPPLQQWTPYDQPFPPTHMPHYSYPGYSPYPYPPYSGHGPSYFNSAPPSQHPLQPAGIKISSKAMSKKRLAMSGREASLSMLDTADNLLGAVQWTSRLKKAKTEPKTAAVAVPEPSNRPPPLLESFRSQLPLRSYSTRVASFKPSMDINSRETWRLDEGYGTVRHRAGFSHFVGYLSKLAAAAGDDLTPDGHGVLHAMVRQTRTRATAEDTEFGISQALLELEMLRSERDLIRGRTRVILDMNAKLRARLDALTSAGGGG